MVAHHLDGATPDAQQTNLTRQLSAKDASIDLMALPVSWMPEFAASGWAQPLTGRAKQDVSKGTLEGPLATASYKKKLYGAPFTSDVDVLWYKRASVSTAGPLQTWAGVIAEADRIAAASQSGDVQASRILAMPHVINDGITSFFVALAASDGGALLDKSGKHAVVGNETVKAAVTMQSLVPHGRFGEHPTGAVFAIDSTNYYAVQNLPVPEDVAVAPWPKIDATKPARPTLGGTNLVVSAYSKHQKQAIRAMNCLRSFESQKTMITAGKQLPTLDSLYASPEMLAVFPNAAELTALVAAGTPPLQSPLDKAISRAVREVLVPLEEINPATFNDELQKTVDGALEYRSVQN